ncbi:class I tRNA ligase family protein [Dickeya chrysanthemi]|uniref:class I tRNA ligase family protein n=1 Tax=Dickeya chrysanthemi TaxID=556 RepID=UPI0025A0C0E5|nr:class I tRNA ligase family protein [Dickeya chrysanthemi]WJM87695.1 class I tRNA ligase family protein [Dickeya chrysanthemi]
MLGFCLCCPNALAKFDDASDQGRAVRQEALEAMVLLLNPITPHASHALWQVLGRGETLLEDVAFPQVDAAALVRDALTLAVQINGKLRGTIESLCSRTACIACTALLSADPTTPDSAMVSPAVFCSIVCDCRRVS